MTITIIIIILLINDNIKKWTVRETREKQQQNHLHWYFRCMFFLFDMKREKIFTNKNLPFEFENDNNVISITVQWEQQHKKKQNEFNVHSFGNLFLFLGEIFSPSKQRIVGIPIIHLRQKKERWHSTKHNTNRVIIMETEKR